MIGVAPPGRLRTACLDLRRDPAALLDAMARIRTSDGVICCCRACNRCRDPHGDDNSACADCVSSCSHLSLGSWEGVDLLLASRFFVRSMLAPPPGTCSPWIARELVAPGGFVFVHHFRDGVQVSSITLLNIDKRLFN